MFHHVSDRGMHCVLQLKSLDSQPLSPAPSLAAELPEPGVEAGDVLRRVLLDGRASVLGLMCLPYVSALYVCLTRAVGWACLGPRPPPILASALPLSVCLMCLPCMSALRLLQSLPPPCPLLPPSPPPFSFIPICPPDCLLPSLYVYVYAVACACVLLVYFLGGGRICE